MRLAPIVCLLGAAWTVLAARPAAAEDADVEARLQAMSLEEKVGQVLLVGVSGKQVVDSADAAFLIRQMRVGGIILLGRNVSDPLQLARLNRDLQELVPQTPLFIALDQEGGTVVRLSQGATVLPGNMALGATRSRSLAYFAGRVTGAELHAVGVNMNLAPVLDVNSNRENPVIGVRAYGDDVQLVAELGTWYVRGLQEMGVVGVAKHFPGHGETDEDSHHALPRVPHTGEYIRRIDLPPFRAAMRYGNLDAVMTAHVRYPGIDGEPAPPATMSRALLTGLLRDELNFDGLVVTDDLEMAAIADTVGIGPAAVRAIEAGADLVMVIWHRESKLEAYNHLIDAVHSGELPESRLDEAVRRILTIKKRRGILDAPPPDPSLVSSIVGHPHHKLIATEIARRSITELHDPNDVVPLKMGEQGTVLLFSERGTFATEVKRRHSRTYIVPVPRRPTAAQRARLLAVARRYQSRVDTFVVAVKRSQQAELAKELAREVNKPVVAVALGSPYELAPDDVDAYLCSFSWREISQVAAARALLGGRTYGVAPVALGPPDAPESPAAARSSKRTERTAPTRSDAQEEAPR